VVAQFLQHDSRDRDPQLHVHNAILNRVQSADGTWRALDGKAILLHKPAAAAVGERVMEAHLAATLGVRLETRPDGKAREVVGVPTEVMDLFSNRRRAITGRARELVAQFAERFGRDPSPLEHKRIAQQATLATRAAKRHDGETDAQRLDRWERETRQVLAGGLAQVARDVVAAGGGQRPLAVLDETDVIERAVAAVADSSQTWTRAHLMKAVSDALPGDLQVAPDRIEPLLKGLTGKALARAIAVDPARGQVPRELQLADGRPVHARPGSDRWTAPDQLAAERLLREAAVERVAARCTTDEAAAVLERVADSGIELGGDQAAALRGIVSSGAQLQTLVAPAGSGKSFVVGQTAAVWAEHGGRVLGLAPSQIAANVLADEGVPAMNLAAWRGAARRGEAPPADLLVVDEAGMARTEDLRAVVEHARATGATVLLVGDPRQLAAVGPGGALADVSEHGTRHELTSVRRFSARWEAKASLQLRDGDAAAVVAYDKHGRLVDGGTAEQAETAAGRSWLADTVAGRSSVLLVGSNEAAGRLSGELRRQLVELGRVTEHGVPLGRDGNTAGIGDVVQARRNDWTIDARPVNRATYRVIDLTAEGGLVVEPTGGGTPRTLPPAYVADDVALAYASTVHAAQGRTVDTSHAVLAPGQGASAAYVALTRGRDTNTAYVVTRSLPEDTQTGQTFEVEPTTARSVVAGILEKTEESARSALGEMESAATNAVSIAALLEQFAGDTAEATAGRTGRMLDQLTAEGVLTVEQRQQLGADQAVTGLDRLMRTAELAGHEPLDVLRDAAASRGLSGSQSIAQVLNYRIRESDLDLTPRLTSARDLVPTGAGQDMTRHLEGLADRLDERRHELGAQAAAEQPRWAVEALGPVPGDPLERAEWEQRAGWAAAHREAADVVDGPVLGAAPPAGLAEKHALWRTAHAELDLPECGADEALMSDGQLRARVAAAERENAWAPRYVAEELAATEQRLAERRADADLWMARADSGGADAEQLRAAAGEARAEEAALAERVAQLTEVDDARSRWLVETVVTRNNAERARVELASRGVDVDGGHRVTAQEWLDAHLEHQVVEDQHRDITETDVADLDLDDTRPDAGVETAVADIRDSAPDKRVEARRVPTMDEVRADVERARLAIAEMLAREAFDEAESVYQPPAAYQEDDYADDDAMTRSL